MSLNISRLSNKSQGRGESSKKQHKRTLDESFIADSTDIITKEFMSLTQQKNLHLTKQSCLLKSFLRNLITY